MSEEPETQLLQALIPESLPLGLTQTPGLSPPGFRMLMAGLQRAASRKPLHALSIALTLYVPRWLERGASYVA